ncbi:MerR family transcriptional regulator [Paenibacillus spongiae]|uniref:MerR family DNA-binding protein n=1 Tax=Paenibacillus spongiae TaxID=2909671 RepID=A0ABY5S1L5_9BACL|nr:MerR family transcriptional regulator [Paenibacillus spongiae]UVI27757.1 MerR family DNA-binding protein [Paenibacillus spongiae]
MEGLTVSQVARAAKVRIETVRYYERRGLIAMPPRTGTGYRMFASGTVDDIRFIKRAQQIGFTLEEIKSIIALYKKEEFLPTEDMYQFAAGKIQQIDEQIKKLQQFKSLMEIIAKRPAATQPVSASQCPVIQLCALKEE